MPNSVQMPRRFCRANYFCLGQDDSVYAEHRCVPLKMTDRPPSSPSRFDLKTRLLRSQSLFQSCSPILTSTTVSSLKPPANLFEVIHRPPSQHQSRLLDRQTTDPSLSLKASLFTEKTLPLSAGTKTTRPESVPSTPTSYQVKCGGKIYKVVVGYVSPFTSPLQRNDLHLKTDEEVDIMVKQIKQEQDKQRNKQRHMRHSSFL
jgi:hypothetical protein